MATARYSTIFMVLVVLLASAAFPAAASQLNLYTGVNCSGSFTACFDRNCCTVPSNAVSYQFYYNPNWRAFFYGAVRCESSASNVLAGDVVCANGVNFRSALLTDGSSIEMVTEDRAYEIIAGWTLLRLLLKSHYLRIFLSKLNFLQEFQNGRY
ncbi:unnamed protein product [Spirodela intermedia]|uniref:Uncharacterized protein n=1 Tax=Spirodela intermedia TaxID=51605 RepID=A0A7I8JEN4_SPIIN|nr:unnamed protein product [Spirodela intermedia]CAA6668618.1 unnamed protein product [Spirodela intermedia]